MISFEIKTRSIAPIRYDVVNYKDYLDYDLTSYLGLISSYEREQYDMIRGAFMKYYYQLKIGAMDGLFISYHNTLNTFGFEYLPLDLVEKVIYETRERAELSFLISGRIATAIFDEIKNYFKDFQFS